MKKSAFAAAALAVVLTAPALAEDATMTGDEIRQMLIGNSTQYDTRWGYAEMFRDPDGTYYVRNSQGQRGKGNWTIEDNKFCIKWTETYQDWRTNDSCMSFTKIDDEKVRTESGTVHKVRQGDPTKVKL